MPHFPTVAGNGKRKLQLEGEVGMLLAPELNQGLRKPTALPLPAVNPGVTRRAKSNQQFFR